MRELIQQDYNKITDFRSDWLKELALKYQLTEEEILNSIEL